MGGPASWLRVMNPVWSRELATARSSRRTSIGVRVAVVLSAKTSAVASSPRASSATVTETRPAIIVAMRTLSTTARIPSAAITIRRRSSRSDSTPAYRPNTSGGAHRSRAASDTRNGSRVSDATSSGPAATATPSPRFVVQDDANSQRKPAPSRAGTRPSTTLLTRTGPYVCRRPSRTPIFVTGSGTPSGDVVHLLNDIHALQTRAHPQRNRSERLHRVRRLCGCRDPLLSFDPRA